MSLAGIAVVGPGRINRSIAQAFLWAGHPVAVIDLKPRDGADRERVFGLVRDEVERGLRMFVELGRLGEAGVGEMLARLSLHAGADADRALAAADVIVEGVPEDLAVKQAVLGHVGRVAGVDAIILSATSTILVDELAAFVDRPGRFLNAHFLNPAWLIPLVELSAGTATDAAVLARAEALLRGIGKVPVRCAPTPGFIVPRVQMLAGGEAIRLLEEGVASAADIDRALRIGFALRFAVLGFLEFSDWGGLDIAQAAGDYLADKLGGEHYRAPPIVEEKLKRGEAGMYAGLGFFDYRDRDIPAYRREVTGKLLDLVDHVGLFPPPGCAAGGN
jgi:3-hydroxybutyryl-CoA dehydrogenase